MSEHNNDDYYCAERDSEGNIRLNCGRGLMVANADHTRDDVQGWFDRSKPGQYREQYRAALALFDRETRGEDEIPITTTPRGFHVYGDDVVTTYGHKVSVYESSAAESPHVWLAVEPGETASLGHAHLNEEQARAVVARLQAWLDAIPARWNVAVDGGGA
ncbi:hypothetical protein GS492_25135 [Rhodococcus hoagii]|nr:hypothetical protein [Prescottella equi]NKR75896.1 hypothetical protein [Prescottella equi]